MAEDSILVGRTAYLRRLLSSIGTKIIFPYLLLTMLVGGIGAFVVTMLVTSSLQERFNNQLLDAGRIVADEMVAYEETRLAALRNVAGTEGVPQALARQDVLELDRLVPQIIANTGMDAVALLDLTGVTLYGRYGNRDLRGVDFSGAFEVQQTLAGQSDALGDKQVFLSRPGNDDYVLFTIRPVQVEDELVGAVMVGTSLHTMLVELTETAIARVTLYDQTGRVLDTTLATESEGQSALQASAPAYARVLDLLQEAPEQYQVVAATANSEVPLRRVEVSGREYTLAYGDWRLRGQSFGLFSVALPSNFITNAAFSNRLALSLLFSIATAAVFGIGFWVARSITIPLNRLVRTALDVSGGNLERRTGLQRADEIGTLAVSFDAMTENLVDRNRLLVTQASELQTILNSIADGVVVLDVSGKVTNTNPAADRILADMSTALRQAMLQDLPRSTQPADDAALAEPVAPPQRYRVGNRYFSALAAPMFTPGGEHLGTVIAMRDTTREAEAEFLQDGFITSISHELRTPLTTIKGYSDLLKRVEPEQFSRQHQAFLEKISSNADRLLTHINKLIDITEIQAGSLALRTQTIDLVPLVTEIVQHWADPIAERELKLVQHLPESSVWVEADPVRLRWAIDNLLHNAHAYTPAGKITVQLDVQNGQARLDIIDTGVGISAADQPYLFTRFFRAHNSSDQTFNVDGVGLGLFITRSIATLHSGGVACSSKLNAGSTFSLLLPVSEAVPEEAI